MLDLKYNATSNKVNRRSTFNTGKYCTRPNVLVYLYECVSFTGMGLGLRKRRRLCHTNPNLHLPCPHLVYDALT